MKTKSTSPFQWTEAAETAFTEVKQRLTLSPVLAAPTFEGKWSIETDASDYGIAGVLKQAQNGVEKVIAYYSMKLSKAQRKYSVTERECLAVITGIVKFRCYIEGTQFSVITDNSCLRWLKNLKDPQGRLARWALRLQDHDFEVIHRPGTQMVVPDALSRAIGLIDTSTIDPTEDPEHQELIEEVRKDPQKYPIYRVENDILYRNGKTNNAINGK